MGNIMYQLIYNIMARSPMANTPQGQQFMQILQNGDEQAGIQMAQNMCNSYGISEQEAKNRVKNYFGF